MMISLLKKAAKQPGKAKKRTIFTGEAAVSQTILNPAQTS